MVYIHGIRDVPCKFVDSSKKYYIQYDLLKQKVRLEIKFD